MRPIVLRRHLIRFYLHLVLLVLLGGVFGYAPFLVLHDDNDAKAFVICACIVLFLTICFTIYRLVRDSPAVCADKDHIRIGSSTYRWSDLEEAAFNGVASVSMAYSGIMYGMMLRFKDGKERWLMTSKYPELWRLKLFVKQVILETKTEVVYGNYTISSKVAEEETYEWQKGNVIVSYPMATLVMGILFFTFLAYRLFIMPVFILPVWWLASYWSNYAGISQSYIGIRGHFAPWKKQYFALKDVEMVMFLYGTNANTMVVVNRDMQEHSFCIGTLRRKDIDALKERLEGRGIATIDDVLL